MSEAARGPGAGEAPLWHARVAADVLAELGSHPADGLSAVEAATRLARFGPNALPEGRRRSLAAVFVHQFQSPLIYLLLAAAAIAFALGEHADAVVVIVVVMLNALLGAFQEGRAERSLAALRRLASLRTRVLRGGREVAIEAGEVVAGDLLLLAAGDAVAADARLVECAAFEVAEAALTGESLPVAKGVAPLPPDTLLADRCSMVFTGTHVTAGRARAVVVATGLASEIGRIARLAETAEEPQTPLERRVAHFGRLLVVAALALVALVLAVGIARPGDEALDGRELDGLADPDFDARIERISVFARVHPEQKLRIVAAYQRRGDVVAMTGDGVNDAPALAKADVGVAMGITGTDVAKQASKIVVTDDNFATIVSAVAEGRLIYRNIQKLLLYLFSTSAAEVVVLRRPPVPRNEPLLTRAMLSRMLFTVPAMAFSTLGRFIVRLSAGVPFELVRSETFTLLAACQWFNALNCRSVFGAGFGNRWLLGGLAFGNLAQVAVIFWAPLNLVFHSVPIGLAQVPAIGATASLVLWVEEARKAFVRRRERNTATAK